MAKGINRRQFSGLLASGLALPWARSAGAANSPAFRIRTITAGLVFNGRPDLQQLAATARFLERAKQQFETAGYEVQTLRVATQPLAHYLPHWKTDRGLAQLRALDGAAADNGVILSLGPVITGNEFPQGFADWAAQLISDTGQSSFSALIASAASGLHQHTIAAAADAITRIAGTSAGGEGNFRFTASAYCPAGTPFFPAAWFDSPGTFSIGLESPRLLLQAVQAGQSQAQVKAALLHQINTALKPLENTANAVAASLGRRYLGMDTSPAPGLDASIGEVIEALTGSPFGNTSTLSACALLTDVLKGLEVQSCGYSGLMLPVLEDRVLAERAAEGRFDVNDLLLYSSVCGTGLDVVPLAGDTPPQKLAGIIGDVAALAHKYRKTLSARLFPVPGKQTGDPVSFDNPYLTDSVILDV